MGFGIAGTAHRTIDCRRRDPGWGLMVLCGRPGCISKGSICIGISRIRLRGYTGRMSWAALILIVVMAIAGSKFTRHSLTVLAALASIGALVWFLAVHTNNDSRPHASLTQGAIR
jgi:hypothetical protein